MACQLTDGIALPCGNFMPGIKNIWIANFFSGSSVNISDNLTYTASSTNVITAMTLSTGSFYKFSLLKEAGEFLENIKPNPNNGTLAFEPTVNLFLSQYSTAVRNKIVLLGATKVLILFQDRNNQYFVCGTENGMSLIDSTSQTGKEFLSSQNGYNLSFTGQESTPAFEVSSSLIAGITSI